MARDNDGQVLGPWTLVTRRRNWPQRWRQKDNRPGYPHDDPQLRADRGGGNPRVRPIEPPRPAPPKPIFGEVPPPAGQCTPESSHQRVEFKAETSAPKDGRLIVKGSVGRTNRSKPRVSKAFLDKELLKLGPVESLPRKRRKNSADFTDGGVASPSVTL